MENFRGSTGRKVVRVNITKDGTSAVEDGDNDGQDVISGDEADVRHEGVLSAIVHKI